MKLIKTNNIYLVNELQDDNCISSFNFSSESQVVFMINNGCSVDMNGNKVYAKDKENKFEISQTVNYVYVK